MQMIDVVKRLAELDASNPRVEKPVAEKAKFNGENAVTGFNKYTGEEVHEHLSIDEIKKLSGLTESVSECGMMGMPGPMGGMSQQPPATFSINASAANGNEVSTMLRDILNLAGMKEVGPKDIGGHDDGMQSKGPLNGEPPANDIEKAIQAIDQAEMDDEAMGDPAGADADMDAVGSEMGTAGPAGGDVGAMADQVQDMADQLAGTTKDELGLEANRMFDNSPQEQTRAYDPNDFAQVINKVRSFDQVPARGGDNPLPTNATESVEAKDTSEDLVGKLFAEYKAFKG
jgi:hypothetical protein